MSISKDHVTAAFKFKTKHIQMGLLNNIYLLEIHYQLLLNPNKISRLIHPFVNLIYHQQATNRPIPTNVRDVYRRSKVYCLRVVRPRCTIGGKRSGDACRIEMTPCY